MVGVRALGLMMNDPARGNLFLQALRPLCDLPVDVDGVGVASSVDGAALVSRSPTVPAGAHLRDVVGPFKGRCAVVQMRTRGELRPHGVDVSTQLGPWRARSYAGAVVGGPQSPDEATASRDRYLASLPEFLLRAMTGHSEGEAFFLAALAKLHTRGLLESAHNNGRALADCVRELLQDTTDPRHVVVTNGVELVHVSVGMASAFVHVDAIAEPVALALDPAACDSSTQRERLRQFRGLAALGALDRPLVVDKAPAHVRIQSVPVGAAALVTRDLHVTLL
jgi:hypothetical protein